MRIIRESHLQKMLKEVATRYLNIGDGIGYQRRVMDERNRGTIIPGYDMDKDLGEILKRKGCG